MRTNKWLEFRERVADRERSRVEDAQKLWEENRKVAWSRTQTAYALEVATLSGAYVVMDKFTWIAFFYFVFGGFVSDWVIFVYEAGFAAWRCFSGVSTAEEQNVRVRAASIWY